MYFAIVVTPESKIIIKVTYLFIVLCCQKFKA